MRRVIVNLGKGSQGKTFTTIRLAQQLVKLGLEVTAICLDSQASLAHRVFGHTLTPNICDVLTGKSTIFDARVKTDDGWHLVSANEELGTVGRELDKKRGGILALREAIAPLTGIILLDPVADLTGFAVEASIVAADLVVGVATPCPDGVRLLDFINGKVAEYQLPAMGISPKFAGVIANRIVGAYINGDNQWHCRSGSLDDRATTERLMNRPDLIGHVPYRAGKDQREVNRAFAEIAKQLVA